MTPQRLLYLLAVGALVALAVATVIGLSGCVESSTVDPSIRIEAYHADDAGPVLARPDHVDAGL